MPPLQWSTPARHNEVKSLTPLPTEIYLAIFSYTRTLPFPKRHLQSLSLACRLFYVITIPWIFGEFTFTSQRFGTDPSRKLSSLSREIRRRDRNALEMAKYINRCNFEHWQEDSNPKLGWCFAELISLHSNSLRSMSNLKELSLKSTLITRSLLKAMAGLSHIHSLMFYECTLDADVLPKHLSPLSSLNPKVLHHSARKLLFDDNSLPFETLFDHLNLGSLVELESHNDHILHQLVRIEGDLPLVKAVFRKITTYEDVANLVAKTPALQSLHISFVENVSYPLQLESHLLPRLKSLKILPSGFDALVGNRNVLDVTFNDSISLQEFQSLQKSLRSFTSMCVPAQIYIGFPFWKHFPELETLEITFRRYRVTRRLLQTSDAEVDAFVSKWPKHPAVLQSLYLNGFVPQSMRTLPSYFSIQYSWITDIIFPKIPSLRRCRFDEYFTWFYLEEDAKWRAEINAGQEQNIIDQGIVIEDNEFVENRF